MDATDFVTGVSESPVSPAPAREHGRFAPRLLVVMGLAFALYGRAVGFGFSYLDDNVLILDQQSFLSRPSSLWRSFARPYFQSERRDHAYYRPVVISSFGLDALWTGSNPLGYHLTNVGLHACAAGLLFLLLRRLGHGDNIAFGGGLWFAAHPALTEAVAWIPGRNDTLMTVFALASWLLLLRCWDAGRWSWANRIGHLLAWLAALFTKEAAIVLPIAYLLHLAWVERRPWRSLFGSWRASWLPLGWLAMLGLYLGARAAVLTEGTGTAGVSAESLRFHFLSHVSLFFSSLGKLVLPIHLSVLAIPEDTWLWPGVVAAGLLAATLFVPGVRRARVHILFGSACFVVFVAPGLPASNLLVLESRLYLPAVGIVFVACAICSAMDGAPRAKRGAGQVVVASVVAVVVAALAISSFGYSDDFRDRLAFCQAAVRGSPHSALAHRNLGVTYQVSGHPDLARHEYEDALNHDATEAIVHNNLGVLLMARGQLVEAEEQLRQELAINPRYADAHNNLALVLRALGRADEAARHWEMGLELNGDNVEAMRALLEHTGTRDASKAARLRTLLEGQTALPNPAR